MEWIEVLHVDTWSQKLKADQKVFRWALVKNGCGQPGNGTLKLTVSQKWTDGIKLFFSSWYNKRRLKVVSMIFG